MSARLVADAIGVFARLGYRVPVRKLASELGVTTGALYHHFGSKDEMFLEVLRASVLADAESFPELPPEVTAADRVRLFLRAVREREVYLLHRFLVLHELLRQRGSHPHELVEEMELYAARLGRFFLSDDPALGPYLLSLVNGVLWRRYLDGGRTRWEDVERLLVASIGSLLAAAPPPTGEGRGP